MVDLFRRRAAEQPNDLAYIFLSEKGSEEAQLTFAELYRRAGLVAAHLQGQLRKGDRALLMFPPGLDFIAAFFGCLAAGVIAVPMMPPRRTSTRDSSETIIADCAPAIVLANSGLVENRADILAYLQRTGLKWIAVETLREGPRDGDTRSPDLTREDVALLQYTSGSTSAPKGVMVTHGNLLANLEMIRITLGNTRRSTHVVWIPFYHDMGLVLNILESFYLGALCVVLSPTSFMQRPFIWLHAIDRYKAEVSSAPNFAFDRCVTRFRPDQMAGLDLSCWKIALNGAEPVRATTIEQFAAKFAPYGFDPRAMYPAYGMAEATLLISGGRRGGDLVRRTVSREALQRGMIVAPNSASDAQVLVGCGHALVGEEIAIFDPELRRRQPADAIGEIWVRGANVAAGYWQNSAATAETFAATIAGAGGAPWLRTGDLGFLDDAGEIYITGRIKDVIIIYGNNHYPQDIEATMQSAHPALRQNCGAAFSYVDQRGMEKLVLVQEVERTQRHQISPDEIEKRIRESISNEHDIAVHEIVLIRPGSIPKTTSGKIQRRLTQQLWHERALDCLKPDGGAGAAIVASANGMARPCSGPASD
jgi:acyl-CoA synthetase (AMP-forming)/AMP-acid ligase II